MEEEEEEEEGSDLNVLVYYTYDMNLIFFDHSSKPSRYIGIHMKDK